VAFISSIAEAAVVRKIDGRPRVIMPGIRDLPVEPAAREANNYFGIGADAAWARAGWYSTRGTAGRNGMQSDFSALTTRLPSRSSTTVDFSWRTDGTRGQ
jgi:hypothetical protein